MLVSISSSLDHDPLSYGVAKDDKLFVYAIYNLPEKGDIYVIESSGGLMPIPASAVDVVDSSFPKEWQQYQDEKGIRYHTYKDWLPKPIGRNFMWYLLDADTDVDGSPAASAAFSELKRKMHDDEMIRKYGSVETGHRSLADEAFDKVKKHALENGWQVPEYRDYDNLPYPKN